MTSEYSDEQVYEASRSYTKANAEKFHRARRRRSKLSLEAKMKIFEAYHMANQSIASLSRQWGIGRVAIKTVIDDPEYVKKCESLHSAFRMRNSYVNRRAVTYEIEKMLSIWIEDQLQRNLPISVSDVKSKAVDLYTSTKRSFATKYDTFIPSDAWFNRYRQRAGYSDLKMAHESLFDVMIKTKHFPDELKARIEEGKYLPQQVFNVDAKLLFWKSMPDGTYISKEAEELASDRVTLVLGYNVTGDCKLQPLIICNRRKRRYGIEIAHRLPAHFQSKQSSWLTAGMFGGWFVKKFIPETKRYCKEQGINFKILLLLDTAARYRNQLNSIDPNVNVIFLPQSACRMFQPMDQGIMPIFKAYYLLYTLNMVTKATKGDTDIMVQDFCESYTIQMAYSNIKKAWTGISKSCLISTWIILCPQFVPPTVIATVKELCEYQLIKTQIINAASKLGFEMTLEDVENLINSSGKELTKKELFKLAKEIEAEKVESSIDLTDDKDKETTVQEPFNVDDDDDEDLLDEYSPKPSISNDDEDSMSSEELRIDYIKVEEPQLIEPSNCDNDEMNNLQYNEMLLDESFQELDDYENKNEIAIAEEIELAFDHITCAMEKFESVDPNKARFQAVRSAVNDMLACYREMFEEKRHIHPPGTEVG